MSGVSAPASDGGDPGHPESPRACEAGDEDDCRAEEYVERALDG